MDSQTRVSCLTATAKEGQTRDNLLKMLGSEARLGLTPVTLTTAFTHIRDRRVVVRVETSISPIRTTRAITHLATT